MSKNILLVTRPITPPWDEASKNFAWELAKNINKFNFHLLTDGSLLKQSPIARERENIKEHAVYTSPDLRLSTWQKSRLFNFLLNSKNEIPLNLAHFLFTPSPFTTRLVKNMVLPRWQKKPEKNSKQKDNSGKIKTIQTLATLDFKKISRATVQNYLFADQIVTHSNFTKRFLNSLDVNNVKRIYPGIDLEKFKPEPKKAELLKRFNLNETDKTILYTGEYVRLRAMDTIMQALPLIIKSIPKAKLILACRIKSKADQKEKAQVAQSLKARNLEKNVIFVETFSPMQDLYNLADLFIFPVKEMTGKFDIALTVIEALATGKPSIISDIPPLNEAIQVKDSALLLENINPKALAQETIKILRDDNLSAKLGQNARTNAQQYFDIKESVKKYEALYQEMLN